MQPDKLFEIVKTFLPLYEEISSNKLKLVEFDDFFPTFKSNSKVKIECYKNFSDVIINASEKYRRLGDFTDYADETAYECMNLEDDENFCWIGKTSFYVTKTPDIFVLTKDGRLFSIEEVQYLKDNQRAFSGIVTTDQQAILALVKPYFDCIFAESEATERFIENFQEILDQKCNFINQYNDIDKTLKEEAEDFFLTDKEKYRKNLERKYLS